MEVCQNKIVLFIKQNKSQYFLSLCLFSILFIFAYLHAAKGLDLTDEGMYLSAAMRYSLGDLPFRDEIINATRPFDVIVAPVFIGFPNISLLQMRYLGLLLHSVSIFGLFLFLSCFAPPLFIALVCSSIFFSNIFILSPNYNSLSSDFSILAVVFLFTSCLSTIRFRRILFAIIGGCFFTLFAISYPPQAIVILIPIFIVIYGYFFDNRFFLQSSAIFLGTFASLTILAMGTIVHFGLLPDLINQFSQMSNLTEFASKGVWLKVHDVFEGLLYVSPPSLKLLGVCTVAFVFLIYQKRKRVLSIAVSLIIIIAVLVYAGLFCLQHARSSYVYIILSFTFILGVVCVFLNDRSISTSINFNAGWIVVKNSMLAWGFISFFVYGISSGLGFRQCIFGAAIVYTISMVTLYRKVRNYIMPRTFSIFEKASAYSVMLIILLLFSLSGIYFNYHYTYRESKIINLTTKFKHPKLAGVYSTPEKVTAIETLLRYLQDKVKPGDYLLCYNNIPMIYFLTHAKPSYGSSWATNEWPDVLLNRLVKKMINENKVPEYCVRTLVSPAESWGVSNSDAVHNYDPLNEYIMSNYHLEKIISPFEIWHYGKGRKFQLFDQIVPAFKSSFCDWKGPDTVRLSDLAETQTPLTNLGYRGDFKFSRISSQDGYIIRVSPIAKSEKGEMVLQFGYTLNKYGFDLKLNPEQEVIFVISVRLSDLPKRGTSLFIQDQDINWERVSTALDRLSWEQYAVSKKIRKGATRVDFGISWQPENINSWLEIKDVCFYICDENF